MAPDSLQRGKLRVIALVLGVNLVFGALLAHVVAGASDPAAMESALTQLRGGGLNLLYQIAVLVLCFAWLHLDSRQLDIRRPWWLNVGIVLALIVFVPYYLYKTRPAGHRGNAILGFFGLLFLCLLALVGGMMLALMFKGGPPSAAPGI